MLDRCRRARVAAMVALGAALLLPLPSLEPLSAAAPQAAKVVVTAPVEPITVEIIRGDKRAREIVRQEQ